MGIQCSRTLSYTGGQICICAARPKVQMFMLGNVYLEKLESIVLCYSFHLNGHTLGFHP